MMSAVSKVYLCKIVSAQRTPEWVEKGIKAVQGVLQVMFSGCVSRNDLQELFGGAEDTIKAVSRPLISG